MSEKCEHKWVYMTSTQFRGDKPHGYMFTRVDEFYCEKCCETKEKRREHYSRGEKPDWWLRGKG
jgi:hypothetical protein